MGSLVITDLQGVALSEAVDGWFAAGTVGQAIDYAVAEVRNNHPSMTVSGVRLWMTPDPTGGGFAVAVLDGTARSRDHVYTGVDAPAGSYSSPTTAATGLLLPDLPPSTKALIAARRDLTTVTTMPAEGIEVNRIRVTGTASAGYA